jgi:hypothetical protein
MRRKWKGGVVLWVVGMVFLSYTHLWGADWKEYAKTDRAVLYYDARSVARTSKNVVRVSEKRVFTVKGVFEVVKQPGFGKEFETLSYATGLSELQCADKKKRTLSITWYSGDGKTLSSDSDQSNWKLITPGSTAEALRKILCK